MLEFKDLSKIGFGGYRISVRSAQHRESLEYALSNGCNLIDTSSNYTDGESEILIGDVLKNFKNQAFVVTKAGYIQGNNLKVLAQLHAKGKAKEDLVEINPELKHSIHPEFLDNQIEYSLKRLNLEQIDAFLLHNPEYFFQASSDNNPRMEYLKRIKMAFEFLEEQVKAGKIRYYGISSNTFASSYDEPNATKIDEIMQIANEVKVDHHFKVIQFPYNLIEMNAQIQHQNKKSLIERAKEYNLTTLANRPLNAFQDGHLLRLATYHDQEFENKDSDEIFDICMHLIEKKWLEAEQDLSELQDIPLIKQFDEIWQTLPSPDAVDQVFYQYFFPFIARLWGGDGVPAQEAQPFYLLHRTATFLAKRQMSEKAHRIRQDLVQKGVLSSHDSRPFSQVACDYYLDNGIDHVLVGMRKKEYINDLMGLF